jgi:hypothetical protein
LKDQVKTGVDPLSEKAETEEARRDEPVFGENHLAMAL